MLPSRVSLTQSLAVLLPLILLVSGGVVLLTPASATTAEHALPFSDDRSVELEPVQGPAPAMLFGKNGYEIEPLARFDMEARILGLQYYRDDREAELCPVDAVMGWGPMSRADIVSRFRIEQQNRWCYWESTQPPLTAEEVIRSSANMHLIPSGDEVARQIGRAQQYDIVRVRGYLVEARAADGWTWTSSLRRDDTGNRSCEIIWVESLEIVR